MTVSVATNFRTEALTALGHHGLLTTAQLHAIVTHRTGKPLSLGHCRRAIAAMAKSEHVESVNSGRRQKSWYLTSTGSDAIAGIVHNPVKMNAAIANGPTAAHLGVVNMLGVQVMTALGPNADVSWTHEQPLPLGSGRYLRPDAVLSVLTQQGGELVGGEWFVEADRGTESTGTLVDKLVNYREYCDYRPSIPGERDRADLHWRTRFRNWPNIMFVFDCRRATNRLERLAAWAGSDPRLEPYWNKLTVSAVTDLAAVNPAEPLLQIPTLERRPWLS